MLPTIVRNGMAYGIMRAGLTIWGPHTNVRRGPFSHTGSQEFLWGALFFPKKLTTF